MWHIIKKMYEVSRSAVRLEIKFGAGVWSVSNIILCIHG